MTYKHHTRLELVEGGNIFKQGDHPTLKFIAYDSLGNEVDLTNKQIEGALYSRNKGIMYEAPASFTDGRIVFTIDELLDNGKFQLEFTATDSADPDYRTKFPSDEYAAQLTIKPSKDNMDFVGVSMTTVAQLKGELQGLQTEFAGQVLPRVDIVEDKQTQLEADYQAAAGALTEDSEVILARKGEPNLRAFNDKVVAQLAETAEEVEMKKTFHASKAFAKLKRGEPATIVFLGDSTTEQNGTTNGQPNHVGLLTTWLSEQFPGLVTIVNAGISGHSIKLMFERLQKDVLVHNPDLVIVCSGINDQGGTYAISLEEFKKNYDLLIQEIISQDTTDVILRTTNVVMSAATSSAIDVYNEVTRSLAIKYDLGLFDLFKEMQKDIAEGNISVTTVGPFLNDSVHPNENGHQYMYERFKTFFIPKKAIHKPTGTRKMISAKGGFRHVGGTEFAGVNYVNGYALLFNQPNKRISFEYEGEDFSIIFAGTAGTGQFKVFVDGVQQGDIVDTYRASNKFREFVSYSVSPGKHLVEIEGQATKNASSSSTNLQIQAVIYKKEGRINEGLIPLPYSYLDVRATASIALTDGVEKAFVFNSVPFNIGDIASYVLATGEITFKKAGLYQIYFSNRFVTEPDKSLEANYKVNGTTIKRAYSRTPNSVAAATPSISLDLTDIRVFNVGDKLTFAMNAQGTSPSDTAYAVIVKIG